MSDQTTKTGERTVSALAGAITAGLDETYDLVYVDHRDGFTEDQVAAIVRGDNEKLWESTEEWESDQRYASAEKIVEEAASDVIAQWEREDGADYENVKDELMVSSEKWEPIRWAIEDRDAGKWPKQMASQTSAVLLRIAIPEIDEDHSYFHQEVTAADVLTRLGIEASKHNVDTVQYALDNASPEFSLLMGYWIVGADVSDLYDLPAEADTIVEITNPHLYLGNPFMGSGFITEAPVTTTVRVKRSELRTDKDAFGHSVSDVYGGLTPSQFSASIKVVPSDEASPERPIDQV